MVDRPHIEPGPYDTIAIIREMHGNLGVVMDAAVRTEKHLERINGQLDAIQAWRWMVTGGFTVIVFLLAVFGSVVLAKVL